MTRESYVQVIAFLTAISVGLVALLTWTMSLFQLGPASLVVFILAVLGMFAGGIIFPLTKDPLKSGIGVGLMGVCAGIVVGFGLTSSSNADILFAVYAAGAVTFLMSIFGIAFPRFFEGLGAYLFAGLSILLMVSFGRLILAFLGVPNFLDIPFLYWCGVGLFSLYIAHDWASALSKEYTLDNAIDAAGQITLSVVNLFLQLLGTRRSSDRE